MRIRFRIQLITSMRTPILIFICGSGSGFLVDADADSDADPSYQNNADPCGSGSTTVGITILSTLTF
jgi:hypothetical protein